MTTRILTLSALTLGLTLVISGCNEDDRIEDFFEPGDTVALTSSDRLITFDRDTPNVIATDRAISGLPAGEVLLGIDYRTDDLRLYALTNKAAYQLALDGTLSSRVALRNAGNMAVSLSGASFGVDFNPRVDLLRVINDNNQSLTVNVESGLVNVNANPVRESAAGDSTATGAAYTNNTPGAVGTTLYVIDVLNNRLATQNTTSSVLSEVAELGVDAEGVNGFDIEGDNNTGYAALMVAGVTTLFDIDLAADTNAATRIAPVGNGSRSLKGLALRP